jgi:hypothetical protein
MENERFYGVTSLLRVITYRPNENLSRLILIRLVPSGAGEMSMCFGKVNTPLNQRSCISQSRMAECDREIQNEKRTKSV